MKKQVTKRKRLEKGLINRLIISLFKDIEEIIEPILVKKSSGLFEVLGLNKKSYHFKSFLNSRLKILIDNGFVLCSAGKYSLTEKGKHKLLFSLAKYKNKPRKWDKKWRVVMFDVYESQKSIRDRFRRELKEYGFIQMQRSVWVYPYECEDFIALLKIDNNFGKNVRYGVLEVLEGDGGLREYFEL